MVAVLAERAVGPAEVAAAVAALRDVLGRFDAALIPGAAAAELSEVLVGCERSVIAARLAVVLRAADCRAFPPVDGGRGDAADWLAQLEGGTRRQAADELRLADRLDSLAQTAGALAGGRISVAQAAEIALTEADAPGSEADMLALAQRADLASLKEEGRRRRHRAIGPDELARRQRKNRSHRRWVNELGMECGTYALLPGEAAGFHQRLDAETDRRVQADKVAANQAARNGQPYERQTRDQHAADAFAAAMCNEDNPGAVKGKAGRADVVITVDLRALLAGTDGWGQLIGSGPVSIDEIREMLLAGNALLKVLLHDGVDVLSVKHHGRKVPAELRTALSVGAPPEFRGPVCAVERCGRRHRLQLDHKTPVAGGGMTSMANLQWLCWLHHQAKTDTDRATGYRGPP